MKFKKLFNLFIQEFIYCLQTGHFIRSQDVLYSQYQIATI